jgi:hypothetical protein
MYFTQRNENLQKLQEMRQSALTASSGLRKEYTSTVPESGDIYSTTESKSSHNLRNHHSRVNSIFEYCLTIIQRISESDLKKYINSKTIKVDELLKTTHKSSKSLFLCNFISTDHDGKSSVDRSKIKVRRSLIREYKKSKERGHVDIKKMYDQFVLQKTGEISIKKIKRKRFTSSLAPSTLDNNTPKMKNFEFFGLQEGMREARGFQNNKNTPKHEGIYRRSGFDEKAVGEAWKRVKEYRKRILRLNQNHLHVILSLIFRIRHAP